jgi:hypothetical protein
VRWWRIVLKVKKAWTWKTRVSRRGLGGGGGGGEEIEDSETSVVVKLGLRW